MAYEAHRTGGDSARSIGPRILGREIEGSDFAEEESHLSESPREPSLVYVPSQRVGVHDSEINLELRQTETGEIALLAYSALDLLVGACGDAQPWTAVRSDMLESIRHQVNADRVLWNIGLPAGFRKDIHDGGDHETTGH